MPEHKFVGYMDAVDFFYEGGEPIEGNTIFADIENLKKDNDCIDECGIVKVEVRFVRWEQKPKGQMAKQVCPEDGKQVKWVTVP